MMVIPGLPSRDDVVVLCEKHGYESNGLAYNNDIWIKYGTGVTLSEAKIQKFVHENADSSLIYTPAVYDCFSAVDSESRELKYIVMERAKSHDLVEYTKQ